MSRYFIDRPIFAWVIAIVIMLAGALAVVSLPIAQYPDIAPPAIVISTFYPGASAKTVQDSVTQVIEQRMKGLDNLMYVSSQSEASGAATITLTFDPSADPDIAQVQVQNKVQLATPLLPQEVQRQGVQVAKASATFLAVMGFVSEDGRMSAAQLSDYLASNVQDRISRAEGVGSVTLFGSQNAMRIWLDPHRLNQYKLTVREVSAAIQAQNAQISGGQLGALPAVEGQRLNATITAQGRLETPEQFNDIVLRTSGTAASVRLGDVARVELGSESYDMSARYNGKPAAGLAVSLATGANALATVTAVNAAIREMEPSFPTGTKMVLPYDTTPFVRVAIRDVIVTLLEAIALVFLVMYLFLQNFRATLIPTIAVPVVLLGTFGVLSVFGYSINTLTMFAIVLAIGLLVDDAIVVVENVERVMAEEGLSPLEATRKSMSQITGALVGIGMVLSAVFVPMAFFGGSTGVIYRQFSVTIVTAMILSVIVAIVLTPALTATILRPVAQGHAHARRGFFGWFNHVFDRAANRYVRGVSNLVHRLGVAMIAFAAVVALMVFLFLRMPAGFLPDEDQGVMFVQAQLPAGATQEQTLEVMKKVEHFLLVDEKDSIRSVFTAVGFGFGGAGQNTAVSFAMLNDWSVREDPAKTVFAIQERANAKFSAIREAMVFAFAPPAILELGNASGFNLQLQDRGNLGHAKLTEARNQFLMLASQNPKLTGVRPNGQENTPQFELVIDHNRAGALGVSVSDINETISGALGSRYVDDFLDKGRVKKVFLQADAPFRMRPEDLELWRVRNAAGETAPLSSFATTRWTTGSPRLERYNDFLSLELLGMPAPGTSSGEAMNEVEKIARQLPAGIGLEWTGLSYQERLSGSQAYWVYMISLVVVFLCLAALYESWSIPVAVMLVVPLGVVGALMAATMRGFSNDIYFQVGLLTTVGLAAKNAILIVEFANELHEKGMGLIESALEAARLRLRPILMTSMAFMLGVLPLVISSGAGSGSQNAIGTGVFGGMFTATALAIFLVPVFFVLVRRKRAKAEPAGILLPAGTSEGALT